MTDRKIIIDTNVFIGLEDTREVDPELAKMLRLCAQHGVRVFVHEAAIEDIKRDRDLARRKISLSKVRKFEQLTKVRQPSTKELAARFGPINKPNDSVDVALLHAVEIGAVDFLITQDQGIHSRARRCVPPLADRVLTVADALNWLRTTFEPKEIRLPLIEELPAHAIPLDDDMFDSLREGYSRFDDWWREKCVREHRRCWVATVEGELAGLVVRKEETHAEAGTTHTGPKILKICTFKVKPKFRGEKLGELLLKQILWFAQRNSYDLVYLTTYSDQTVLIRVLEYFGFQMTGTNGTGEQIYEKPLSRKILVPDGKVGLFELARANYPRFVGRPPAKAYCIPIKGEYHNVLFPELGTHVQGDLFSLLGMSDIGRARTPGNTIRKVYLCRARVLGPTPGSVLLFYRSKSPGYVESQSITSVGVVEAVTDAKSLEDLVRLTAKRSVYTTAQLERFVATPSDPVKVIDFLLIGHLDPPMPLHELTREGVFNRYPPQSICYLPPERITPVLHRLNFGFEI